MGKMMESIYLALTRPYDNWVLNKDDKSKKTIHEEFMLPEQRAFLEDLFNDPTRNVEVAFTYLKDKSIKKVVNCREDTAYAKPGTNDYLVEHDDIYHGTIYLKGYDKDGNFISEAKDIYFYQPHLTCESVRGGRVVLGPSLLEDKTLANKFSYCFNELDNGKKMLYYANLPKREILSNQTFDFDSTNRENFDASTRELFNKNVNLYPYIKVEFDRDPKTNRLKPIPKEKEKEVFEFYQKEENHFSAYHIKHHLETQLKREQERNDELKNQRIQRKAEATVAAEREERQNKAQENKQTETERQQAEVIKQMYNKSYYGWKTNAERGLSMPQGGMGMMVPGMPPGGTGMPPEPPTGKSR